MELLRITSLKKDVAGTISSSRLTWVLKCPLRAKFENPANACYRSVKNQNYSAMMGNVIHKVLEQSNLGKIRSDEDFQLYWHKFENAERPGGLMGMVKNYGSYKFQLGKQAVKDLPESQGTVLQFKSHIEKDYFCPELGINGRPDIVIFKDGLPYEIKDYKSGNIFEHIEEEDIQEENRYEFIKEEYRQQLLTYALIIYANFSSYPKKLSIINFPYQKISASFDHKEANILRDSITSMREDIGSLEDSKLAKPSALNCRFCIYSPGCQFSFEDKDYHLQGLTGRVSSVQIPPAGNFVIILDGNKKVFSKDSAGDVPLELLREGSKVYLSKLIKLESHEQFWIFSKLSKIYLFED